MNPIETLQESEGPFPWTCPSSRLTSPSPQILAEHVPHAGAPWSVSKKRKMDAPVWEQHVSSINLDEAALEVLRSVDGHTSIFWRLPSKTGTAGSALNHAINVVKSTLEAKAPMSFKLGYTRNPSWRWDNTLYGYKHDLAYKFQAMLVLCISEEPHSAAMMEAALISYFKGSSAKLRHHPQNQ